MTIHALIRRFIHRLKAKRLHGVHSPFVFNFASRVISRASKFPPEPTLKKAGVLSGSPLHIMSGIMQEYQYPPPVVAGNDDEDLPTTSNILVLRPEKPGNWIRIFNKYYNPAKTDYLFVICGIHRTRRHTAKWNKLCAYPKVLMSIDLYHMGLIWFRPEFLEKQHFMLY